MGRLKILILILTYLSICSTSYTREESVDKRVQELLSKMTLDEKIGQLFQVSGDYFTGPQGEKRKSEEYIKAGKVGSCLNICGVKNVIKIQRMAMDSSRLKIPLLFGMDVLHGYRTIFPVPLGLASSWDPEGVKRAQKIAAKEAAASGISWTFAPMLDVARDPRWGRIVEGFGEDPYLVSVMGRATVEAFQGRGLEEKESIMATAKHYVGYGAVQAGREYNSVDLSKRTLWEIYMPPFKAAIDANIATVMTAFTSNDGVPMIANKELVDKVLRGDWRFQGITVSDWNAIHELISYGIAENGADAACKALNAGVDIDMVSGDYLNSLASLVKEKRVPVARIDKAVERVLRKKFELGLFDNPYKYCDSEKEKKELLSDSNREEARKVARESIVLLKNENNLLPLRVNELKSITVIGPLAENKYDPIGSWHCLGSKNDTVTVLGGIREAIPEKVILSYQKGSEIDSSDESMMSAAVNTASKADIIIAVLGESADMSGEASSRASIELPESQKELLKALYATGKPIVLILMNGRPLALSWENGHIPAILETWFPGTEGGHAIADLLFGRYNPSAKLPVTFPKSLGQVPLFYNHLPTGRPIMPGLEKEKYVSMYLDIDNEPLYHFGYGLSYTTFNYSPIMLDKKKIRVGDSLTAGVEIRNSGKIDGEEIVQLYIRDNVASVVRPVMELKGFKKVLIKAGESVKVSFKITPESLKFYNKEMEEIIEPGTFDVYIGSSSAVYQKDSFTVIE